MEQDHESGKFLAGFRARRFGTRTRSEKPARVQELEARLRAGDLQCITCLESIAQKDDIWSCKKCFNILHLKCTYEWAAKKTSWTCPACRASQTTAAVALHSSYCFCTRAVRNPPPDPTHTPHTCGGRCNKSSSCPHAPRCALPCPPDESAPRNLSIWFQIPSSSPSPLYHRPAAFFSLESETRYSSFEVHFRLGSPN